MKELTSRQRNWFPNFEKSSNDAAKVTETPTSVESSRRQSVKNDSVPQTVSNLIPEPQSQSQSLTQSLTQPGDRRPLLGARNSSDSIEDYIRNWKGKGDAAVRPGDEQQQEGGGGGSNDDSR